MIEIAEKNLKHLTIVLEVDEEKTNKINTLQKTKHVNIHNKLTNKRIYVICDKKNYFQGKPYGLFFDPFLQMCFFYKNIKSDNLSKILELTLCIPENFELCKSLSGTLYISSKTDYVRNEVFQHIYSLEKEKIKTERNYTVDDFFSTN